MSFLLEANELSCERQKKIIFKDISFSLEAGKLLVVEGANGSGKSSLLRLLTGLATPAAGEILWQGKVINAAYQQVLHYLGHANGIKSRLTVAENLYFKKVFDDQPYACEVDSLLHELQLLDDKHTELRYLSAGQKRRVALAKLILLPKPLWILDEPFTALDKATYAFFIAHVESHLAAGGLAVISTHQVMPIKACTKMLRMRS